ncbi:hypothetical protein [Streptomyces sp. NBC_01233]|uniref:hypothetical protein n=1 Tax=Streptomyces sp. NBC_01233 TaxID=2903787 RepID=UPI002E129E61|nr:hypothetical protein OG332_39545 [Streptomyces sp. NBC_01233]
MVLVPAALTAGALAPTVDRVLSTFGPAGRTDAGFEGPGWALAAGVTSGLFVLWGPLLAASTRAHYAHRCRPVKTRMV